MGLSMAAVDELFATARRIKRLECNLVCVACAAPLEIVETARRCPDCNTTNVVFRSCFAACDAIAAVRSMRGIVVAPTAYVPHLGWVVGYRRIRQTTRIRTPKYALSRAAA
jgi:hypothetical protein